MKAVPSALGQSSFIRTIRPRQVLSFGPDEDPISLESLNVLIGPNAGGKSNLIDVIGLLRAAPQDLAEPIRQGGGIADWLWKGAAGTPKAEVEITVSNPHHGGMPLRHRVAFTMVSQRFELVDEVIENERPYQGQSDKYFYYRYQGGRPVLNVRERKTDGAGAGGSITRELRKEDLVPDQSVLSQRKDPDQYPEITYLGRQYARVRLYRE